MCVGVCVLFCLCVFVCVCVLRGFAGVDVPRCQYVLCVCCVCVVCSYLCV